MEINPKSMKRIEKAIDKSAIQVGREIAELERQIIQRDVYDYYDKVRSGYITNRSQLYDRTYNLIDNIVVKHSGKGKVVIRNEGHSKSILDDITSGRVSWKKSVLYHHFEAREKRDFMKTTLEELEEIDLKNKIKVGMYKNGIRINF